MSLPQRILETIPDIRVRAAATEQARCIPSESIAALRAAGLFRAFTPRRYGGEEHRVPPVLEAVVEVARACSSTGWVSSLLAMHPMLAAWSSRRLQDELWGEDPNTLISTGVVPTGTVKPAKCGYRLSGRWRFSSGVDHCSWALLGALIDGDPDRKRIHLFVPAADFRIEDDWHVAGLCGTGSKTVLVSDAFVPEHRAQSFGNDVIAGTGEALAFNDSPIYRHPWRTLLDYAFAPVAIGTALAALDQFRATLASRRNPFTGNSVRESHGALASCGESGAEIDTARLLWRRDLEDLDERCSLHCDARERFSAELLARAGFNARYVVELCSRAVYRLFRASGAQAIFLGGSLQRHFRDMHAITQHGALELSPAAERHGQFLVSTFTGVPGERSPVHPHATTSLRTADLARHG